MNPLTKRLHSLLSQDIARQNAATATGQVLRARRERAEVEAYLAQVDLHSPRSTPPPRKSSAG